MQNSEHPRSKDSSSTHLLYVFKEIPPLRSAGVGVGSCSLTDSQPSRKHLAPCLHSEAHNLASEPITSPRAPVSKVEILKDWSRDPGVPCGPFWRKSPQTQNYFHHFMKMFCLLHFYYLVAVQCSFTKATDGMKRQSEDSAVCY